MDLLSDLVSRQSPEERGGTPRLGARPCKGRNSRLDVGFVWVNNAFQLKVAEAHAQRVVAACEAYHAANSRFPRKLDELVPHYLNSVPRAKYCLGPPGHFSYYNLGAPMLVWQVVPPHYRRIYNFETRSWSRLD